MMNWNFMMAGAASTNPLLLVIAVGLILAWKVSGYIEADYWLLRWTGTPWVLSRYVCLGRPIMADARSCYR